MFNNITFGDENEIIQCLPTPTKLERNAVDVNTYRSKQIFPIGNDSVYISTAVNPYVLL